VQKRKLGNSNLEVSAIGLGWAGLGWAVCGWRGRKKPGLASPASQLGSLLMDSAKAMNPTTSARPQVCTSG
jgi:aryl-alcohol dehydrogenase-like predicted oxidoreductase